MKIKYLKIVKSNPNDTRVYGKKHREMCRKAQAKTVSAAKTIKKNSNNTNTKRSSIIYVKSKKKTTIS